MTLDTGLMIILVISLLTNCLFFGANVYLRRSLRIEVGRTSSLMRKSNDLECGIRLSHELLTDYGVPYYGIDDEPMSVFNRIVVHFKSLTKKDPYAPPQINKSKSKSTRDSEVVNPFCPKCDSDDVEQTNVLKHPEAWKCRLCLTGFKSDFVIRKVHHKMDNDEQIFFYEQEYYVFSNFSAFNLTWWGNNEKGLIFPTSEHAYHWNKFHLHPDIQQEILKAPSAHEAFKIARSYNDKRVPNWDELKVNVMEGILQLKVKQHPYVKQKLLESGDRELIEDSWRDPYWGWGENKDGQNMLGKLWMKVRDDLRAGKL